MQTRRVPPGEIGIDLGAMATFLERTGPLAVVDLETTGLSNDRGSEILEVGIVQLTPGDPEVMLAETLVRPREAIPRAVVRLTGLTDADVEKAPRVEAVAKDVFALLMGRTLVAHNADFERHFLSHYVSPELGKAEYLDTQDLLCLTHPDAPDMRLETFTRDLLETEERHRALSDALDTLRVMSRAAQGATRGEARYVTACHAMESYAQESAWVALLDADPLANPPSEPSQYVRIPQRQERPVAFDPDAIADALADAERGRRHFANYRVREQQIQMAREFAASFADGDKLLLEGGTGVGKSLAYLAAAIPFAMERAAGGVREPVVISTRTKLLQDQLLVKDIPAAAAMLGYPDLRALSIKGRANYVCSRRLAIVLGEGREPSIFEQDRLAYAALAACAKTRPHGEIASLAGAMLWRFPPLRDLVRRSVAARAEQCTREQCASEKSCPFGRRRRALADAHLVVANHDLLLRWPPDYPNITSAIIDEAHELAGVADEVYAVEVRPEEALERIDDLFGRPAGRAGTRRGAGRSASARKNALLPSTEVRRLDSDARAWRRGLLQDFSELGRALADRASEFGEVQLPADADRLFPEAADLAKTAAERLDQVASVVAEIGLEDEDTDEAVERIVGDLRAASDGLRAAFANHEDSVAAFERLDPPFDRWRLVIRSVSPAAAFHERFAHKIETMACVSASLFVGGDPFASLGELEIENLSNTPVRRVLVDSPFDYQNHMRVLALQSKGDLVDETAFVIGTLARELGGRTLGLFTSLRRMNQVGELLAEHMRGEGFDILSPRRANDDPAALVERFRNAAGAGGGILLGARTFWQGLDIPGDALQAVVIEKLPFEVPTELRKRREKRLASEGENAFERFTLGKMLLNLKQMAGRLIRTEDDRGIVVIVEGRTDRRYFERLSEALPKGSNVVAIDARELPEMLDEVDLPGITDASDASDAAGVTGDRS